MSKHIEGWNYLINSPKWHFFKADGRSLCGRWLTFARDHHASGDDSPDNCAACKKKVVKLREQAATTARPAPAGSESEE